MNSRAGGANAGTWEGVDWVGDAGYGALQEPVRVYLQPSPGLKPVTMASALTVDRVRFAVGS